MNKKLRILVAERNPDRLLQLERTLNQLGYYGIAPMRSFDELFAVLYSEGACFDVLFVNAALLADHGFEMMKLLGRKKKVLNTLVYDDQDFLLKPAPFLSGSAVSVFIASTMSAEAITSYMTIVDVSEGLTA